MTTENQTLTGYKRAEIADALNVSKRFVAMRATREQWPYAEISIRGGKRRIYQLFSLPHDVQDALARRCASLRLDVVTGQPLPRRKELTEACSRGFAKSSNVPMQLPHAQAHERLAKATHKARAQAEVRRRALVRVIELCRQGMRAQAAKVQVVEEMRADGVAKASLASLWRWEKMVEGTPRSDWLAMLLPGHLRKVARRPRKEVPEAAWTLFASDYLRPEKPSAASCYERMRRVMDAQGVAVPSLDTFQRRLKTEMTRGALILGREGEKAFERTIPAQERDESVFRAMEAVNMDGHVFDVFIHEVEGEEPWRPLVVGAQDVYSRKALAMQVGRTESSELIQRAVHEMVRDYGIPEHVWFDNGKAFASKQLTGGVRHRNRFKVKPDEPLGVLPALGCEVHFTKPYHGQAKPIERMWRDLEEWISKHPALAGAYAGNNPMAKPENYRSRSVPKEVFLRVLAEGLKAHNARRGRRTTACEGVLSFDEAFAASYAQAQAEGKVRQASQEQLRMLLQATEVVNAHRDSGMVTVAGNRYWDEILAPYAGQKVQVRYDPEAMQAGVEVYTLDGAHVGFAECKLPVGFNDRDEQRETARIRKQLKKVKRDELALHRRMETVELARVQAAMGLDGDAAEADAAAGVPTLGKARRQRRERVRDAVLWEPGPEERAAIQRKQDWLRKLDEEQREREWLMAVNH